MNLDRLADLDFADKRVTVVGLGVAGARRGGVPVWSMLPLFMELCPGPIVGVTGSSGKTTTTALLGEMFRADEKPVFVGGNIGIGLLDHLPEVRAYTWVVLEVSHTQLQMASRSPHVACLLNVTPNHLDRFTWERYVDLKRNIYRFQAPDDVAVFSYDDAEARGRGAPATGTRVWFSLGAEIPDDGVYVRNGEARFRRGRYDKTLFSLDALRLRGTHNRENAVAAAAVASACGVTPDAIASAVASFAGVPHRLEHVATLDGTDYYNDSIA